MYIYQRKDWPKWKWDESAVNSVLFQLISKQGYLLGKLAALGFDSKERTALETGVLDVLKNSEIEGEKLLESQVRSSIARKLGIEIEDKDLNKSEESEGAVNLFLDATQRYNKPLSASRVFDWHAGLFPTGRSAGRKIEVAKWRTSKEAMQIVSGAMGREAVHYEAPGSANVSKMMKDFFSYFNTKQNHHPFIKAAIAHLWFEVIHPFEDGNRRVGRALVDMLLCEADSSALRFYSFSNSVLKNRKEYYSQLNKASKGSLDVTEWILWFLNIVVKAMEASDEVIQKVDFKRQFWLKYSQDNFNERQLKIIRKLLEGFEGNITSSKWSRIAKCTRMTATRDINVLLEKNVLVKNESGGRSTSYKLNIV